MRLIPTITCGSFILLTALLAHGVTSASTISSEYQSSEQTDAIEKQRGVSWVGGNEITLNHMIPLAKNNVGWIVQTPFGWQTQFDSPQVGLSPKRGFWGETDEGLRITSEYARKFKIKTLLKPHLWLRSKPNGKWRADIDFETEEGWNKWFESYGIFILHYAKFAQANGIEALCIATELHTPAVEREADWRKLIAEIREVYDGKLTYAANWYKEYEEIKFWDALDFIGIQGYFPIADKSNPTIEELKKGWEPHVRKIERLSKKFNKPIVFTEQGYKSTHDTAIRPWEWPQKSDRDKFDLQTQANCYEAFFQTFWDKPWCAGVYWWKWFPRRDSGTGKNSSFSPQGKPSEAILRKWFEKE